MCARACQEQQPETLQHGVFTYLAYEAAIACEFSKQLKSAYNACTKCGSLLVALKSNSENVVKRCDRRRTFRTLKAAFVFKHTNGERDSSIPCKRNRDMSLWSHPESHATKTFIGEQSCFSYFVLD